MTFVSYLTVEPIAEKLPQYIQFMEENLLKDTNHEVILLGRLTNEIDTTKISEKIKVYNSIANCISSLQDE
jgi:hypothetical protein